MDAIQAIDGTVSVTLDAVRALLSGDSAAPAEPTPAPHSADLGNMGRDTAVSASSMGTDVVRADASSTSASMLPDTPPITDGRATLAALAAQTQGTSNATERQVRALNVHADVDTAAASRPLDSQVLPTPTSPLHTQAAELQRATHLPNSSAGVDDDTGEDAWHDEVEYMPDDSAADDAAQRESTDDDAQDADALVFANDPDYTTLRQWLVDGEQHAALRELDIQRRVILIVPSEAQARRHATARMHLLSPHGADAAKVGGDARSFAARWWQGHGARSEWTAWRLHREAGIAGPGRLQSRHPSPMPKDACALVLRLGSAPPSLLDTVNACLDIADQHRFQQALGSQWSVLALLCPRGLCASRSQQQSHAPNEFIHAS
ncbi:MAG: hypothetical protein JF606_09895 [Burkholderiales bacterium]|jgi:hypothetical protein|nr:hypothetical protein [Burkholderiales bacterium]